MDGHGGDCGLECSRRSKITISEDTAEADANHIKVLSLGKRGHKEIDTNKWSEEPFHHQPGWLHETRLAHSIANAANRNDEPESPEYSCFGTCRKEGPSLAWPAPLRFMGRHQEVPRDL